MGKLVTSGIQTDDSHWPMGDDYTEWNCQELEQWIRMLNEDIEEFDEYADEMKDNGLDGTDFEKMDQMYFWMDEIG